MALRARVDGKTVDAIPVDDRGFQYGDGLFETIAVYRDEPLLLQRHIDRLLAGCSKLGFDPLPQPDNLIREVTAVSTDVVRGVVKLIVSRGSGTRGYLPTPDQPIRIVVLSYEWPDYSALRSKGLRSGICGFHLAAQPRLAGIKHLNRLEQVLARAQWQTGWQEGLLQDQEGFLISGTQSNLFIVKDGVLMTPPIVDCGIAGIMRAVVMEAAHALDTTVQERRISIDDIPLVEEVFVTNSLLGVGPLRELDHRHFQAGPLAHRLQTYLYEKVLVVPD